MGLFAREYEGPPLDLLPPEEEYVRNAKAARNTIRFFAVALFVLVVGAVFAFTVTHERDGPVGVADRRGHHRPCPRQTGNAPIGPLEGAEVGPYLDTRNQALTEATGNRVAVVSFESYATETDARAKASSLTVDAMLAAALAAIRPRHHGLEAWARTQRQADELELAEIRRLLPTVEDPIFKQFYESELVRLETSIANVSPPARSSSDWWCGPRPRRSRRSPPPGVRLVDVGPEAGPTAGTGTYKGLRPRRRPRPASPPPAPSSGAQLAAPDGLQWGIGRRGAGGWPCSTGTTPSTTAGPSTHGCGSSSPRGRLRPAWRPTVNG